MFLRHKQRAVGILCSALVLLQGLPVCCCSIGVCSLGLVFADESTQAGQPACCCCAAIQQASSDASSGSSDSVESCNLDLPGKSCDCDECFLKKSPVMAAASSQQQRPLDGPSTLLSYTLEIPRSCPMLVLTPLITHLAHYGQTVPVRLAWFCAWLK
jgi:hypothetical protein